MSTIETRYSLIELAKNNGSAQAVKAKVELVQIYGPYVFSLVASKIKNPEDAKEVASEIMLKLFVQGRVLRNYKREKGSFKGYLWKAVKNECLNYARKLDRDPVELPLVSDLLMVWPDEPPDSFETTSEQSVLFARSLFVRAIGMTRENLAKGNRHQHWFDFVRHIVKHKVLGIGIDLEKTLKKILKQDPTIPLELVDEIANAKDLHFPLDKKAQNRVGTVKRRLQHHLEKLVDKHYAGFDSSENKFDQIKSILARPGLIDRILAENLSEFGLDELQQAVFVSRAGNLHLLLPAEPIEIDLNQKISPAEWRSFLGQSVRSLANRWKCNRVDSISPECKRKKLKAIIFGDDPDVESLQAIKELAKSAMRNSCDNNSFAATVYLLAIAAAYCHLELELRISSLTDVQLKHGIRGALQLPWLNKLSKDLLNEALVKL